MAKEYAVERYKKPVNFREIVKANAEKFDSKAVFRYLNKENGVEELSYKEFYDQISALGTYLIDNGFVGKHIAILSESRPEWLVAYMATLCVGSVAVPLDKELVDDQIGKFINFADADIVFYSESFRDKIRAIKSDLVDVAELICFDAPEEGSTEDSWEKNFVDIISHNFSLINDGNTSYANARVNTSKTGAIIFTSGTTGTSKGVMLSQDNLISCVYAASNMVDFYEDDVLFSVLPLHHTYETSCGILTPIFMGATICFNNSLKYFMRNINIFKPTGIVLVPLFISTIYKKIMEEVKKKNKERIFKGAIFATKNIRKIGIDLRRIAFGEVGKSLGGNLTRIISGGAALEPSLINRFEEFGISIYEGYGITECSPLVSVNPPYNNKIGSVGIPIKGSHVKIVLEDEDGNEYDAKIGEIGEVCIKGPQVMIGYYKNDEATAESFNSEGYYKSGDFGYIDDEGYIYITGRKKNIIVLQNGKNVYPEEIEEYLYKIDLISECVVLGKEGENGDVILTAVIFPDYTKFEGMDQKQIAEIMKSEVHKINQGLPMFKQIRNVELKKTEFEKTTTRKIMRHKI